jgi:tRNA A37 threonylcarbamoyltransferase TsaD
LVSGGNSQLIWMHDNQNWEIIGQTIDDAAGECFDKVARMVGLEYPGGAMLSKIAGKSTLNYFNFPIGKIKKNQKTKYNSDFYSQKSSNNKFQNMLNQGNQSQSEETQINPLNYTFSGLKTHIRYFLTDYNLKNDSNRESKWQIEQPLTKTEIEKLLNHKQKYQKIDDLNSFLERAMDDLESL